MSKQKRYGQLLHERIQELKRKVKGNIHPDHAKTLHSNIKQLQYILKAGRNNAVETHKEG